jgi:hypothetical protein
MTRFFYTIQQQVTTDCTGINTGSIQTLGGAYITKQLQVSGIFTVLNTTISTSTSNGALVVNGGVGIAGATYGTTFNGTTFTATLGFNGPVGNVTPNAVAATTVTSTQGITGNTNNDPTQVTNVPTWLKFTIPYTTFATAALTNSPTLFTLPIAGIIHAVKIKHSVAFTGGAISAYTIKLGITGNTAKYASAYNVFQAVSGTNFQLTSTMGSESHTATTAILATATSVGANLNAATAGSCDIWVLLSKVV